MRWIFAILTLPLFASAQQPFGKDATWHYTFYEFGYTGFKKVEHVGDTNMHNMTWLKFNVSGLSEIRTGPGPNDIIQDTNANFGNLFLATQNDSVFRLLNGTPHLLYDLSADVGDSWQFAPIDTTAGCYATPTATVTAKGNITVGGVPVDYIDITMPMDTVYYAGQPVYQPVCAQVLNMRIYPAFGAMNYASLFQPSPNLCDGSVFKAATLSSNQLRCFSNNSLNIQLTNQACNYWSLIGVNEHDLTMLNVYPNPTSGPIRINTDLEIMRIDLYNLYGQLLSSSQKKESIIIKGPAETYLLKIILVNGQTLNKKVIKK